MPTCKPLLAPGSTGFVINTSDVTVYDGVTLTCVDLSPYAPTPTLNNVIQAIDDAICAVIAASGAQSTSDITLYDGAFDPSCFDYSAPITLNDVIQVLSEEICNTQALITGLTSEDISFSGPAPSNYTPTGSSGIDGPLEGIDNKFGIIDTTLITTVNLTDLEQAIKDITRDSWVDTGGVETSGGGSLLVTIDDGAAGPSIYYVDGKRIVVAPSVETLAPSSDNYVDIASSGIYSITVVGIGAPAPPIVGLRLYNFTTDGVGVVGVVDLRVIYPITGAEIESNTLLTRHYAPLSVDGAALEDIGAGSTIDFANVTIDTKGRVTTITSDVDITAAADKQILQFASGPGKWVNVAIVGTILPAATVNDTMRFDGSDWIASSFLRTFSSRVGINSTDPQLDVVMGPILNFGIELESPDNLGLVPNSTGSLGAATYFYRVTARDSNGETISIDEENLTINGTTEDQIDLTWDEVIGAVTYKVFKGTSSGVYTDTFIVTTNSYNDDGTAGSGADSPPTVTNAFGYAVKPLDGVYLPRLTTTQRDAAATPEIGQTISNFTDFKLCTYNGNEWERVSSTRGLGGTGINYVATTNAAVGDTTSELTIVPTGIGSLTIAANTLSVGDTIAIRVRGHISSTGTPDITIRFKVAGVTLITTAAVTLGAFSDAYWEAEIIATIRTIGAGGTMVSSGKFFIEDGGAVVDVAGMVNTSEDSIDTTASNVLDLTAEWGTAAVANVITCQIFNSAIGPNY